MEIRVYRIQRIARKNGPPQFYLNLPKKFLETNKYPKNVFVVTLDGLIIICVDDKDLIEILRKIQQRGECE